MSNNNLYEGINKIEEQNLKNVLGAPSAARVSLTFFHAQNACSYFLAVREKISRLRKTQNQSRPHPCAYQKIPDACCEGLLSGIEKS